MSNKINVGDANAQSVFTWSCWDSGNAHKSEADAIAIVGIGCRFPGRVNSPEDLWRLMRDGVDAITEIPEERWDLRSFYDPNPDLPGKINTRWGGFLSQIDHFDAKFFNISPREAIRMDPQQRLLLEVTWEALEDAGQVPEALAGSRSGVFIGMIANEYEHIYFQYPHNVDVYVNTGCARSVASGRLSYVLGLQGPSLTIDTACSSSLVAVHLACQSLRGKECDLAIAGGVNLLLMPQPSIGWCHAKNLAPDGRCKAFDARANGFIRSEGVGVVVLKPLTLALADRDPIYALIRGSAVNNDGRTSGLLMAPGRQGQEAVLIEAYRSAGVKPAHVQYIEAHGTGTKVGDPIEAQALGAVLGEGRPKDQPCAIGSVKTNIGHTEAAAGIAGLIKVALSLKHQVIPPSLHFQQPNPDIPWRDLPLIIQRESGRWSREFGPVFAGVNSFGISGTNAHVVLQEAARIEGDAAALDDLAARTYLLTLSAKSNEVLREMARRYIEFVAADANVRAFTPHDLCYTASVRRTHHDYRLASVFHSREELIEQLYAYEGEETRPGLCVGRKSQGGRRKLVFVLPGQGSQWLGMGRQLLAQEEAFRVALEECDKAISLQVDWSVMEVLASDEARASLNNIDVIQPVLFAIQVALAAQWRAWGILPDAVVGQSMGEIAAAYIAGALSLDDAALVICRRSRLLKRLSGQGNMVAVDLSIEQSRQALNDYEDRISIAVSNSPTSTVLAGDPAALNEVVAELQRRDIFCREVKVDVASHSPQMEPLRGGLLEALKGLDSRAATLPLYSTVTGALSDGMRFQSDYWWRNLREPVLFSTVVQQLLSSGYEFFLEVSPHPILTGAIQQGMHHSGHEGIVLPSMRRHEDERTVMLTSLGAIYTQGHEVDWHNLYPSRGRVISLPAYAWQRERFWLERQQPKPRRIAKSFSAKSDGRATGHPLLGQRLTTASSSGTQTWEVEITADQLSYLYEHRLNGMALLPAAAYVEMALAAAQEVFGVGDYFVEGLVFKKALFLPDDDVRLVQTVVAPEMPGALSFKVFSFMGEREGYEESSWTLHAAGVIRLAFRDNSSTGPSQVDTVREEMEGIEMRCEENVGSSGHYQAMRERTLEYGASFQAVERLRKREREAVARLRLPAGMETCLALYQLHPVLLDASFQVMAALLPPTTKERAFLPISLDRLQLNRTPGAEELWAHARLRAAAEADERLVIGDISLLNKGGEIVLEVEGLIFQQLDYDARRSPEHDLGELLYEVQWQVQERPAQSNELQQFSAESPGSWLIFADRGEVAATLRSLLRRRGESFLLVYPGTTFKKLEESVYEIDPSVPAHYEGLFRETRNNGNTLRGVLHLWSLDSSSEAACGDMGYALTMGCGSGLYIVQALAKTSWSDKAPRLWFITRGTQAVEVQSTPVSITQSSLWGLGRTIASEHPEFRCKMVDLDVSDGSDDISNLFEELWLGEREGEVALRGAQRFVARLARYAPRPSESATRVPAGDQPFRLEISTPGVLKGLTLRAAARCAPAAGEVEIEVSAAGLNFRDVMKALGIYPGLPDGPVRFGDECAGKVVAVGAGVEDFNVGDAVVAIVDHGFASHAIANAHLVWRRPSCLGIEEAAAIPIVFGTASYALHHIGRMSRGERVLIQAASGGVGLAAVQLAKRVGAEIVATAGSEQKRDFLRSLGVQRVTDSRSPNLVSEVLRLTNGEGVDIVLNSLAGDAIPKGISLLRPFGRFLEIGKRDIYQNANLNLGSLRNSLSFTAIDICQRWQQQPILIGNLVREVFEAIECGVLQPLPMRVFQAGAIEDAFRFMAQANHIGKIVVSMQERDVLIEPPAASETLFREDGSYLITGGLGALGLSVARWMVGCGARHLILMGRNGPAGAIKEAIDSLKEGGANVMTVKADVADIRRVKQAVAKSKSEMPPLRGVIHAAGILDDGILLQQDVERFRRVMAPKIAGAWNLHVATKKEPLDFFILFSSVAVLLGSPGQGNYSAANSFLDSLAHYRQSLGLPAMSVNWGPWSEIGLAVRPGRGERLALRGIGSMTPARAIDVLQKLFSERPAQVAVMPFDLGQWSLFNPPAKGSSLLAGLSREMAETTAQAVSRPARRAVVNRDALLAAGPQECQALLETYLREQLALVLGLSPANLDLHHPLNRLGLDSLMAVEMKNRIELDIGVLIPMVRLLQGPSLAQVAEQLARQLMVGDDAVDRPASAFTVAAPQSITVPQDMVTRIDQMSDEEVESLLNSIIMEKEGSIE
jgi:acyl transferase domain-containing protein/acyl carrier protein